MAGYSKHSVCLLIDISYTFLVKSDGHLFNNTILQKIFYIMQSKGGKLWIYHF